MFDNGRQGEGVVSNDAAGNDDQTLIPHLQVNMVLLSVIKPKCMTDISMCEHSMKFLRARRPRPKRQCGTSHGKVSHGYYPMHWWVKNHEHHCCTKCRYATVRRACLMVSKNVLTRMGNGERGDGTEILTRRRSEPSRGHDTHPQETHVSLPTSTRAENLRVREHAVRRVLKWSLLVRGEAGPPCSNIPALRPAV